MLVGSVTFVASLYLSWDDKISAAWSNTAGSDGALDLLNLFSHNSTTGSTGWVAGPGGAGALCALALSAGAVAALARPHLASRLPLARGALVFGFLAVLTLAHIRAENLLLAALGQFRTEVGFGAYLGVGSAVVVCVAVAVLRRDEFRRPSPEGLIATCLTGGLLAAFLVPDLIYRAPHLVGATGYVASSTAFSGTIFSAGIACLALPLWGRPDAAAQGLVVGAALVAIAVGGLSPLGTHHHWPWQAWLWLGCALGFLALAVGASRGLRFSRPSLLEATIAAAASAVLLSLFLPWQHGSFMATGWGEAPLAGALAAVFLAAWLGWRRLLPEVGLAIGYYVMAAGFAITTNGRLAYGSVVGFDAAALLILGIGVQFREAGFQPSQRFTRILPIAACLSVLAVPIAGLTTTHLKFESPWRISWLLLAAIVVDFRLIGRWLGSRGNDELVLLPLALVAFLGLNLIFIRDSGISWEGWLSLGLCLLLLTLGWAEQRDGLGRFRVPDEIWRIDRLPTVED